MSAAAIRRRLRSPHTRAHAEALLGSALGVARAHLALMDSLLALAILVLGLVNGLQVARHAGDTVLFSCLLTLPLTWRRRAPIAVFGFLAAVAFGQWLTFRPFLADAALFIALYSVAVARPPRAAIGATLVLELGALLATIRWSPSRSWLQNLLLLSGVVFAAVVSGVHMRARRSYIEGLLERAERLEFERDQQARLAATAERARIAREMHDVIAHSLAVVISLANGATAKLQRDPEQSREALESISELGRRGLEDIRQLLTVLHTEEGSAPRGPEPGIEDIAGLVDQVNATGLRATLAVHGEPVTVATGPALGAYRIVQEAITNAVKHADAATTLAVDLSWSPRQLEISILDDGRPHAAGAAIGHGLAGMRERAALYGGSASAGPRDGGGWSVHATIPVTRVSA